MSERPTLPFPLAPMSPFIVVLTGIVLAVPGVLGLAAVWSGQPAMLGVAAAIAGLCATVWLWARPNRFEVSAGGLAVVWPLRRRFIPRDRIAAVRLVDRSDLRREMGWGARVGVGGLWGQFGWAWTARRGWVDLREGRPLLITPTNPGGVLRALQQP